MNGAIRDEVFVLNGLFKTVMERRKTILTFKQIKRVVVDEIGRRRRETNVYRVEVIGDRSVPVVDGAMALIEDDQVKETGRQTLIGGHHSRIRRRKYPGGWIDLAGLDPVSRNIRQVLFESL